MLFSLRGFPNDFNGALEMVVVYIMASYFDGGEWAQTIGQEVVQPGPKVAEGAYEFHYLGDMDGGLLRNIEFSGTLGIDNSCSSLGRGNYTLFVGGEQLLFVGGFFTHVPLAIQLFVEDLDCDLSVHASLC
jgi:hypothetical protein